MYINFGNNLSIRSDEIIGIFDLDNTTVSARTRLFLKKAENDKRVYYFGEELPKSFILTGKNRSDSKVYLSVLSTATIEKRTENYNYLRKSSKKGEK